MIWAALFFYRHFLGPWSFHAVLYGLRPEALAPWKNQPGLPSPKQQAFERRMTFLSALCDLPVFALVWWMYQAGWTKIYSDVSARGWPYALVSFVILAFAQDIYFYFTHRTMHHKRFFKHVHYVHHTAKNPTPWSAFCVHPAEKTLELLFFPMILMLLPVHTGVLAAFIFSSTFVNLGGHAGYEFNLGHFTNRGWLCWASTATFHNQHHQFFTCNYSLYFSLWDKLLKTEHAAYTAELARLSKRQFHWRLLLQKSAKPA